MTRTLIVGAIIVIIAVAILFSYGRNPQQTSRLSVGDATFTVEFATTLIAQAQGLSGRESLAADTGMLFIFNSSAPRKFWMKNMQFPLDIIWINEKRVIGIAENAKPEGAFPTAVYTSPGPADMVLEINAGLSKEHNIQVGDLIRL